MAPGKHYDLWNTEESLVVLEGAKERYAEAHSAVKKDELAEELLPQVKSKLPVFYKAPCNKVLNSSYNKVHSHNFIGSSNGKRKTDASFRSRVCRKTYEKGPRTAKNSYKYTIFSCSWTALVIACSFLTSVLTYKEVKQIIIPPEAVC